MMAPQVAQEGLSPMSIKDLRALAVWMTPRSGALSVLSSLFSVRPERALRSLAMAGDASGAMPLRGGVRSA